MLAALTLISLFSA